jgi:hypothetical protein
MTRAAPILVILALAASACAAQRMAPPTTAPAAQAGAPSAPECHAASRPTDGIHACMPGELEEVAWIADDRWVRGLLSTQGELEFLAARTAFVSGKGKGKTEDELLSSITATWQRVDESQPFELGEFTGRAFAGMLDPQRRIVARAVVVGRQVYFAQIVAAQGLVDRPKMQAFFGSMRIDPPWRLHTSLTKRYTVAVPEPARWLVDTRTTEEWTFESDVFPLGGVNERVYGISIAVIPPSQDKTMDELLDSYAENLGSTDGTSILRVIPITLDGAPGRELICSKTNGIITRMRVYATQRRLAAAVVVSRRADTLEDADAARFFDSFQITAP